MSSATAISAPDRPSPVRELERDLGVDRDLPQRRLDQLGALVARHPLAGRGAEVGQRDLREAHRSARAIAAAQVIEQPPGRDAEQVALEAHAPRSGPCPRHTPGRSAAGDPRRRRPACRGRSGSPPRSAPATSALPAPASPARHAASSSQSSTISPYYHRSPDVQQPLPRRRARRGPPGGRRSGRPGAGGEAAGRAVRRRRGGPPRAAAHRRAARGAARWARSCRRSTRCSIATSR
jgi:hypothetical protein